MQKGLKAINILYFDLFRCRVGILYELGLGPSTLIFEKHKRYVGLITWGYRTENPRNYRVGPIKCIPMTHLLIQVPVLHSWSPKGRIIWSWLALNLTGKLPGQWLERNLGPSDSTKTSNWPVSKKKSKIRSKRYIDPWAWWILDLNVWCHSSTKCIWVKLIMPVWLFYL